MQTTDIRIANRLEELPVIVAAVDGFGLQHGVPRAAIDDLNLALDEVLNNVIAYGFPDGQSGEIRVRLMLSPVELAAEVSDSGQPFDPLRAPVPDFDRPRRARTEGGVGIHFVRTVMDEVIYSRVDGNNVLRLTKRLPPA